MSIRSFPLQMEGELGRFHTQNVILEQRIEQEGEKMRAAENELHRERRKVRGMIGRFRTASTFSIFHLLRFPSCLSLFQSFSCSSYHLKNKYVIVYERQYM